MTAKTLDLEQVTEFATAVRRALSDLGPDILDDLTDGLEADLADKLADGEPLGDPAAYAAELRAAAGVSPSRRASALARAKEDLVAFRDGLKPVFANPVVAEIVSFFVALRPLWWLLRGWALFYLVAGFKVVPGNQWDPVVLVSLLVLSVQWGRGRWLPWAWSRGAVIALSVVALLALPPLLTGMVEKISFSERMNPDDYISDGLLLNKQTVSNIFACGPDGTELTDVRLYDQDGRPLSVVPDSWGEQAYWENWNTGDLFVPSAEVAGSSGWNLYPLSSVSPLDISDDGTVPTWAKRTQPDAPFTSLQQLLGYEAPGEK